MQIAHIIAPFKAPPSSDLHIAQAITFETMLRAKQIANSSQKIQVEQYSAQFKEDRDFVPVCFIKTPNLDRCTLDLAKFNVPRKLPLLKDILGRLYEHSKADIFVYTNVDIALMPFFYTAVAEIVNKGFDAFVINRRTVMATEAQAYDLEWLYQQPGVKHPGFDCFVFMRKLIVPSELGNMFVGAVPWGGALVAILSCVANQFNIFADSHLTFHINDERAHENPRLNDYAAYNSKEAIRVLEELRKRHSFPPIAQHFQKIVQWHLDQSNSAGVRPA